MKRYIKKIIIILIICFLIFGIPLIINLLFKYNSNMEIFRSEWTAGDALAFYGSLLGSSITLIGIWYTIKHERKKQLEENSIMYKPIIVLDKINNRIDCMTLKRELFVYFGVSANSEEEENKFINQQHEENARIRVSFRNDGRGETYNLVIDELLLEPDWNQFGNKFNCSGCCSYMGEILKGNEFAIDILFPEYIFLPKSPKNKEFELRCSLKISYSDMFNKTRYQSIVRLNVQIEKNGNIEKISPNTPDDSLGYYRVMYSVVEASQEKYIYSKIKKKFIHEIEYLNKKGC